MRKTVTSVFAVGLLMAGAFVAAGGMPEASSSDTFRQLKLFGDVFERVRAEYVEEVTDETAEQSGNAASP